MSICELPFVVQMDALDELHLLAVRHGDAIEPRLVVEVRRLDDERLAFPMADRVAHLRRRQVRPMLAAVRVDLPHEMVVLEDHQHAAGSWMISSGNGWM